MRISDWSSDVCSSDLACRCGADWPAQGRWGRAIAARSWRGGGSCRAPVAAQRGAQLVEIDRAAMLDPAGGGFDAHRAARHRGVGLDQIGRAHDCTPVTNAHLGCSLLLEKKQTK